LAPPQPPVPSLDLGSQPSQSFQSSLVERRLTAIVLATDPERYGRVNWSGAYAIATLINSGRRRGPGSYRQFESLFLRQSTHSGHSFFGSRSAAGTPQNWGIPAYLSEPLELANPPISGRFPSLSGHLL